MKIPTKPLALAGGALALAATAALLPAQDRTDRNAPQNRTRSARNDPSARNDQGQMREGGRMTEPGRMSDGARAKMLRPTGFMQIAADYDGDGTIDAIETIYALDYVNARQSSERRMDNVNRRPRKVSGEITNLKEIPLSREKAPHTVGKIKTDRGTTAKVDFGAAEQIKDLNLKEGGRVEVEGRRGRINDKAMLLATKITAEGKTVQVNRPRPAGLRRVKGEVTDLKTVQFRGREGKSVIADMKLVSGREVTANLGSEEALKPLDLKKGATASLIARPGSINDRPALVATRVYAGGETVDVSARGDRERMMQNGDSRN